MPPKATFAEAGEQTQMHGSFSASCSSLQWWERGTFPNDTIDLLVHLSCERLHKGLLQIFPSSTLLPSPPFSLSLRSDQNKSGLGNTSFLRFCSLQITILHWFCLVPLSQHLLALGRSFLNPPWHMLVVFNAPSASESPYYNKMHQQFFKSEAGTCTSQHNWEARKCKEVDIIP